LCNKHNVSNLILVTTIESQIVGGCRTNYVSSVAFAYIFGEICGARAVYKRLTDLLVT